MKDGVLGDYYVLTTDLAPYHNGIDAVPMFRKQFAQVGPNRKFISI